MDYTSIKIELDEEFQDLVIAKLLSLGVNSFLQEQNILEAFIENSDRAVCAEVNHFLNENKYIYSIHLHASKDWNSAWESNFKPIKFEGILNVRADFHEADTTCAYDLVINPKMSFGTGHHETTSMILEWMLGINFNNKLLLDFGCGTGILGIFGLQKLAKTCCFIDNDPLCTENTSENLQVNGISEQEVILGTAQQIPKLQFDFIFANITRNVLLESLESLSQALKPKGMMIISGIFYEDIPIMLKKIEECKLKQTSSLQKNSWACLILERQ